MGTYYRPCNSCRFGKVINVNQTMTICDRFDSEIRVVTEDMKTLPCYFYVPGESHFIVKDERNNQDNIQDIIKQARVEGKEVIFQDESGNAFDPNAPVDVDYEVISKQ